MARNITVLNVSNELGLTDDVALGFIISTFLAVLFNQVNFYLQLISSKFLSLKSLNFIRTSKRYIDSTKEISKTRQCSFSEFIQFSIFFQISLSALNKGKTIHTVDIPPIANDEDIDNFRFHAIHCFLFPKMCDFSTDIV